MEPNRLIVTTWAELEAVITKVVDEQLKRLLPELIRAATESPYMTKDELRRMTGWSDRTIEYRKSAGDLPYIINKGSVLFPRAEVYAYLEAGRQPAKPRRKTRTSASPGPADEGA